MFTNILVVLMGLMCVVAAFGPTKLRGVFSRDPGVPISKAGRGILLVGGLLIIAEGVHGLL